MRIVKCDTDRGHCYVICTVAYYLCVVLDLVYSVIISNIARANHRWVVGVHFCTVST